MDDTKYLKVGDRVRTMTGKDIKVLEIKDEHTVTYREKTGELKQLEAGQILGILGFTPFYIG